MNQILKANTKNVGFQLKILSVGRVEIQRLLDSGRDQLKQLNSLFDW